MFQIVTSHTPGQLLCGVTGFVHNFTSRASLYIILIMAGGRIFAMNRYELFIELVFLKGLK